MPVNATNSNKSEKQVRINTQPQSWITKESNVVKENLSKSKLLSHQYSKPTLNSSKKVLQKMKEIEKGKGFDKSLCVTPTSAALMQEKLTHTLNFPSHRNVFRGLCSVNVNDSVLEVDIERTRPKRVVIRTPSVKQDPEPKLSDFLDPVETFDCENSSFFGVKSVPLKHCAPIRTTLANFQTVFELK